MSMDAYNSGVSSDVSKPISLHQAGLYSDTFLGGISATCQLKKNDFVSDFGQEKLEICQQINEGNINIPPGLNSFSRY